MKGAKKETTKVSEWHMSRIASARSAAVGGLVKHNGSLGSRKRRYWYAAVTHYCGLRV